MAFQFISDEVDYFTKQRIIVQNLSEDVLDNPLVREELRKHFVLYMNMAAVHKRQEWLNILEPMLDSDVLDIFTQCEGHYESWIDFWNRLIQKSWGQPSFILHLNILDIIHTQQNKEYLMSIEGNLRHYYPPLNIWRLINIQYLEPLDLAELIASLTLKQVCYIYCVHKILGADIILEPVLHHMLPEHVRNFIQLGLYEEAFRDYEEPSYPSMDNKECTIIL